MSKNREAITNSNASERSANSLDSVPKSPRCHCGTESSISTTCGLLLTREAVAYYSLQVNSLSWRRVQSRYSFPSSSTPLRRSRPFSTQYCTLATTAETTASDTKATIIVQPTLYNGASLA